MSKVSNEKPALPASPPSQQKLLRLDVIKLKCIKDLSLDFSHSPLTAIMGGNCSGKTTVLHALACAYQPLNQGGANYKFPSFFRPNSDALWKDSDFTIHYSQRVGAIEYLTLSQSYRKLTDRWTPKYYRRPRRHTRFVSIGESVPDLEVVNLNTMIHYTKTARTDDVDELVRAAAGQILNRVYESLYKVNYAYRGKVSIGVKTTSETYSALSMSSGEQRVFRILEAVFRAPKHGLILIDEIDLFLHQDALQRMLMKLSEHCARESKQLVFTTHFPPVAEMYKNVCIYTLNRGVSKTAVWRGYSYEAMRHITGIQDRPVHCYVEDYVAQEIVARVASELEIRKFVSFGRYGPAVNAFSLCAGLKLSNVDTSHTLAVLDGDVYGDKSSRRHRVNQVCTGDQPFHDQQRTELMHLIRTLAPTKDLEGKLMSPEQVLHRMLHSIDATQIPEGRKELYEIALGVVNVPERHGFVNQIIDHTGESREVALSKIIELASVSKDWDKYTRLVRRWLAKQKRLLSL